MYLQKGDFFRMFEKYKGIRDEELVKLYKSTKNDEIELELMERYEIHSKVLAGQQYHKYQFLYQVEYDDLYAIAMSQLFFAIRNIKSSNRNFFQFWKKYAVNEINRYVSQYQIEENYRILSIDLVGSERYFALSDSEINDVDVLDMNSHISIILQQHSREFTDEEKTVLLLYISGYDIGEIAVETGYKYTKARRLVNIAKDKLADILLKETK